MPSQIFKGRVGEVTPKSLSVLEQSLLVGGAEGDHPLLGSLSHCFEILSFDMDILVLETGGFRYPKPRIQHDYRQDRVSDSESRLGVDSPHFPVDLRTAEGVDCQVGGLGLFEVLEDMRIGVVLPVQPPEKGPEGIHSVVDSVSGGSWL